jgi:hypothetical protein
VDGASRGVGVAVTGISLLMRSTTTKIPIFPLKFWRSGVINSMVMLVQRSLGVSKDVKGPKVLEYYFSGVGTCHMIQCILSRWISWQRNARMSKVFQGYYSCCQGAQWLGFNCGHG